MNDISIITATYNSSKEIYDTYYSILKQGYDNWEWVVTDDCSTDDTVSILSEISEKDSRVKILHNNINSGAAVSRNKAIEIARGEYIAFIDSDDIWEDNKLKLQLEFMRKTGCDFSFTSYSLMDETGKPLGKIVDKEQLNPLNYQDMLKKKATLGCSTVMLRRGAFSDISMPLLRTGQDYALWLKLLKSGKLAYHLNIPLTKYRILPNSISRNKFKKAKRQWQIYRELENLSLSKASICFLLYAWRAVFRK